ncbi:protein-arginine deiminase type-1-like [Tachyglossus aculeatus]|uniref:protein-arginine deiminase type-1-like n=1 Tax=Tachyglossus aculeatus TaxID=9261 RepID=UPI0018F4FB0D|nr:protein-arginine deiminase type-1-like [Tachyglossus aculeatus]
MAQQRTVRVSLDSPSYAVCVVGTETLVDIYGSMPRGATSFAVSGSSAVEIIMVYNPEVMRKPTDTSRWPLDSEVEVVVAMDAPSSQINDAKVRISYYGPNGDSVLAQAVLILTSVDISLEVDTGRTGVVQKSKVDKKTWSWGPNGHGAILLVNCDRDDPSSQDIDYNKTSIHTMADLQDMSLMVLRTEGPEALFDNHQLVLHVPMSDADKVGVFHATGGNSLSQYKHVLGPRKLSYIVKREPGEKETTFYVEGLAFPDSNFSGLVSFSVTLLDIADQDFLKSPIFTDSVVFRVAPWIMTPNTLTPLEVFVCSLDDSGSSNVEFLEAVAYLALKANCQLTICPLVENRNDRWIQDEMEFGYVEAPHKSFPVVFDSPRNRGLKDFPFKRVLGPDFGYVTREPETGQASSLDSFGNLDVSPPVSVRGKEYPLGRILIGSSFPKTGGRRMAKIIRNFLYAQKVQEPIELYSDWLSVGHVDEFLTFVPAPGQKGFRLLLASPNACFKLFQEKKDEGHGDAAQFDGLKIVKKVTINEILEDESLRSDNQYVQSCIDWNREVLKRELGLIERDIIDIPQLFKISNSSAEAYFPDMVNMVVLGKYLGIPKPFGPIINGRCCLEEKVQSLLEPLGLNCTFIDDYLSYHVLLGEVHCGTNVRRKPFSFKWWNMIP